LSSSKSSTESAALVFLNASPKGLDATAAGEVASGRRVRGLSKLATTGSMVLPPSPLGERVAGSPEPS
jgi:hypothetical protein